MPEHTPGPWSWTEYEHLLACYRSGQVSERQWQEHLRDREFREWVEMRAKEAAMPDRVIMVRESEWREMREALCRLANALEVEPGPRGMMDLVPGALEKARRALAHPTPDGCGREGNHRWTGPGIGSDRIRCIDCGATRVLEGGDDG